MDKKGITESKFIEEEFEKVVKASGRVQDVHWGYIPYYNYNGRRRFLVDQYGFFLSGVKVGQKMDSKRCEKCLHDEMVAKENIYGEEKKMDKENEMKNWNISVEVLSSHTEEFEILAETKDEAIEIAKNRIDCRANEEIIDMNAEVEEEL